MDFAIQWAAAIDQLAGWVEGGQVRVLEDGADGLEHANDLLVGTLRGDNGGRRMIRVAPDPM